MPGPWFASLDLVHGSAGRARYRYRCQAGRRGELHRIEWAVESLRGVRKVRVNPAIQALVVEYERARLAAIVESSQDAIIGYTLEGAITSWNAGAEAILGYPPARAIGKSLAMLLPAFFLLLAALNVMDEYVAYYIALLVGIAMLMIIGYIVAHYLTFWFETGQQTLIQASDPLSTGANYLGTGNWSINYWLSLHPTLLADLKVISVVTGHVLGVISAHDRAVKLLPKRHQLTGQLPLLFAMVAFTVGGLYLLFAA